MVDTFQSAEGKTKEVKRELQFIDSYKFTLSSLDDLVKNMPRSSFKLTKKYCDALNFTPEQFGLLLRKGVFAYDWFDSFSKLKERKLPPKEAFFSMLYNKDISDDDCAHAQKVWKTFKMRTMKDYHNLYLDSDVILLADVFKNFRDVCSQHNKLDPAWY